MRVSEQVDLVVVGSGGAAFAAAIRASDLGARVVMAERGTVGGTCVNIGCVPSKTLIGGGYVALELGQLFAHLGSEVTIIARSTLMRHEEPQVADTITRIMSQDGVRVLTNTQVARVERTDTGVRLVVASDSGEERVEA